MKCVRILVVVLLCAGVWVGVSPALANDAWLSKIALSELNRSVENGEFDELSARIKGAVLGRISTGKISNPAVMTDLIYVLRACEYGKAAMELKFERTEAQAKTASRTGLFKDGKELFKWLIANRGLSRILFRGMQDVGEPVIALKAIAELKGVGDKKLLAYGELATAFATSRSANCYQEQLNPASIVEAFNYYTTRKMRYDLKTMPYELSRYLTDTKLSIKERQWAYGKYNRYPNPAKSYFDLKYDMAHVKDGTPKKISKLEFTLPNLRKVGGVCIEQAYYSSEVCKALGIPAGIVRGRSGDGGYHAWMMCFVRQRGGRSASWDSSTGRYESQKYFVGNTRNPAKGADILDCELMLEGAALLLPPSRREDADTAAALAVLCADVANANELADLADLQALVALYKKRFEKSPVDPESLKATIKIDMMVVEGFLATALGYNIAHKPAWDFIIELRKNRDMLKVSHLGKFFDVLTSKTAKVYPDYSCEMVLRITPSIPEPSARMKIYQKAMGVYASRRDLQGRIMIACGDDCAAREKPALALKFYETASVKNVDLASIVTSASVKAEKLLVDAGHSKVAIALYAKLFKAAKKPRKVFGAFASQTSYYILGNRLAALLEIAGQTREAQKIRAMIKK
ncbi:MAG: hypothetical protein QGG42_05225 [Phycisphaerae bacterium]|jgi:hypothetical protein|nr:hypothetical protein [Phycisphaerae bacterium]